MDSNGPTPSSLMPKSTTFPLPKTQPTSSTSSKKIHSNKTNQRKKMQKATDQMIQIGLGFRATSSTKAIRRAFNQRLIDEWDDDRSGSEDRRRHESFETLNH